MRKLFSFVLLVLFFSACKFFKKKTVDDHVEIDNKEKIDIKKSDSKLFFTELPWNEVKKAVALDYSIYTKSSEGQFNVFPYSEKGYEFDYLINGKQGYMKVSDSAIQYTRKYENYFYGDSAILNQSTAVWLSKINYLEIQQTGKTKMDLGKYGMVDFKLDSLKTDMIKIDGQQYVVSVARILAIDQPFSISFIRDENYPLIVRQTIGFKVKLKEVQMKEPEYYNYELNPGCILKYKMIENGVDEYNYTMTNTSWNDTAVVFNVEGDYSGSYNYDYNFNVILKAESLSDPNFVVLYLSATARNLVLKKDNQIWLKKDEINAVEKDGKGYLSAEHFFYNPDDFDTAQFAREDLLKDRKKYAERFKTYFILNRSGKLIHTGYTILDENETEQILPTLFLRNSQYETELQVVNTGKYPLVVFYDDHRSYRLELREIGRIKH